MYQVVQASCHIGWIT